MLVGIDLGTTNSLIGSYTDDGPRLFSNPSGSDLTPSAVSIDEEDGVIVGQGALDRLVTHPDRSAATFKRLMGTARETQLGNRNLRPEQLSALVLKSLIADAEAAAGQKVTEAIISVPAYFSDAQRNATRIAGELAGIKVERLINEPTAAALAYGLQERPDGGRFLVFDLGGGTLDISIIEIFENVVEVHASAGDNYLGGEDFSEILFRAAIADLALDANNIVATDKALLRRRIEKLKLDLSQQSGAGANFQIGDKDYSWSIDEARFAQLCEPLIARMRSPLERALRDANISPGSLDEIVLVGGATRMPLVARTATRLLGKLPLRHINPDRAIALGAVIATGIKQRNAALEEVILTDVCPYTLGSDVAKRDGSNNVHTGFFLPIIPRNSTVPISREEEIYPLYEDQEQLLFNIYQGENPIAEKNIKLGELLVDLPKSGGREDRSAILRFTYDVNGILHVEATIKQTNKRYEITLQQNPGVLSDFQIKERLNELKNLRVHPRNQQENLAFIARAERLYEELLMHRDQIQFIIMEFKSILETQDQREINRARQQMSRDLNGLESA